MAVELKEICKEKEFGLSAYKNTDGMNYDTTPIIAIDDEGIPHEKIDIEALDKSIRAFWSSHEKELWAVVILCGFYFMAVLI
jgi:hypothetical protein